MHIHAGNNSAMRENDDSESSGKKILFVEHDGRH